MKKTQMIKNEDGSVLIIALVMLGLLTILGITATSTSNVELQIAGNERNFKRTFFTANAGIEHAKSYLNDDLISSNEQNIANADDLSWSFALEDAAGNNYEDGVAVLTDEPFIPLNNYTYNVKIFDNADDESPNNPTLDSDGIIYAQSVALGPNNSVVKLRVQLQATIDGEAINSYTAQQGGESSKGYSSQDLNPIEDFEYQM